MEDYIYACKTDTDKYAKEVENKYSNHITGQQRGYMAGTRRNRNLPLQQNKQTFTWLHKDNTNLNNNSIRTFVPYGDSSILVGTFRGLNILNKKNSPSLLPISISPGKEGLSQLLHPQHADRQGSDTLDRDLFSRSQLS